ncbi:MAG: hypothetical protein JWP78_1885 [Mucilaginibacter sp.]|nr:hypothetical protein [Mucilaginibacter sp.]
MKPKTIKIVYWVLVILFCLSAIGDAIGGLTKAKLGIEGLQHLGYPLYLMSFLSVLKLLGVTALLQTKFQSIKEWAFAGFAFTFLGAFVSKVFVGDGITILLPPVIMLIILFVLYYFWRKQEQLVLA